ncbi:hypothetical protein BDP67DRAFT_534072 [Colletotrichum lupini]|nr:hypothetical protein BDP67DRAFT_534072 [Colletotrichum lupini]
MTSLESTVLHPLLTFASNISGLLLKLSPWSCPPPPTMLMMSQFLYISRFPSLLNHVQPSTAWSED